MQKWSGKRQEERKGGNLHEGEKRSLSEVSALN